MEKKKDDMKYNLGFRGNEKGVGRWFVDGKTSNDIIAGNGREGFVNIFHLQ